MEQKRKDGSNSANTARKPVQEFKAFLSQDKKYWIFKNITTWIIPVNYLNAITQSQMELNLDAVSPAFKGEAKELGK